MERRQRAGVPVRQLGRAGRPAAAASRRRASCGRSPSRRRRVEAVRLLLVLAEAKIEEGKEKGAVGLGYAYQGPLKRAYPPAAAPADVGARRGRRAAAESKKPVRLVVFGDSDFASDEYLQLAASSRSTRSGAQLLFNAIGWTLEDEALTPVRTKTVTARPIQVESAEGRGAEGDQHRRRAAAFCVFGIVRWRLRRARRQGLKL